MRTGKARCPARIEQVLACRSPYSRLALLELIKIDLEYRWVHFGMPKRLVEYQQEFPVLLATLPNELLHEERHVRQLAGDESLLASNPAIGPEGSQLGGLLDLARDSLNDANRKEILAQVDAGMLLDDFDLLTKLGEVRLARCSWPGSVRCSESWR